MKRIGLLLAVATGLLLVVSTQANDKPADRGLSISKSTGSGSGRRVALVIGNNDYEGIPLRNAVNDARSMSQLLRGCGFQVLDYYNVDRRATKEAIRSFASRVGRAETALVYYSGHGIQVDGVNYLVPLKANVKIKSEIDDECLRMDSLIQVMAENDKSINILILDACRNNPFRGFYRSSQTGLSRMRAPKNSIVIYATAPDSVASDGDGNNGLFTETLIQQVTKAKQEEPVEVTLKKIRGEVARKSGDAQIPWTSSSLTRDFSFNFSGTMTIHVTDSSGAGTPPSGDSSQRFEETEPGIIFDKSLRITWVVVDDREVHDWKKARSLCSEKKALLPSAEQFQSLLDERDEGNLRFINERLLIHSRSKSYWTREYLPSLFTRKAKFYDFNALQDGGYTTANSYYAVLGVKDP